MQRISTSKEAANGAGAPLTRGPTTGEDPEYDSLDEVLKKRMRKCNLTNPTVVNTKSEAQKSAQLSPNGEQLQHRQKRQKS